MSFPRSYAVYDTETTGLDVTTARIVELAAKRVVEGKDDETRTWLIKQDGPLPEVTTRITGITDAMLADAVPLADALKEFAEFIGSLPVVGHNILRYDNPLMQAEHDRIDRVNPLILGGIFDTAALYKADRMGAKWSERKENDTFEAWGGRILDVRVYGLKYSLAVACAAMKVDVSGIQAHRAGGDVEMTDRLWRKLTASPPVQDDK